MKGAWPTPAEESWSGIRRYQFFIINSRGYAITHHASAQGDP